MSTIVDANREVLDYALVQCLRLFAQLGRKIRTQKLPSEYMPLVKMEDAKDLNDKDPSKSDLIEFREIAEQFGMRLRTGAFKIE